MAKVKKDVVRGAITVIGPKLTGASQEDEPVVVGFLDAAGKVIVPVAALIADVFKTLARVAITAGTPVNIWAPAAGKKFRLMGIQVSASLAADVIFKDDTTEIARVSFGGAGQEIVPLSNGILSVLADNILKVDISATGTVGAMVWGREE